MSKINIKMMSDVTYATLKKNIEGYVDSFKNNMTDSSWINDITSEKAFNVKRYMIEDFELDIPKDAYDHTTELKNAITLYEHLRELPGYILAEPKFWLWVMFEKGYAPALKAMEKIDATAFNHQWLFADGLRRGLFFGILSRLYFRVDLTYDEENKEDPYYLTKYIMENPNRFREISWRAISNYRFVVKSMIKAEMRVNNELKVKEKGEYYQELAKEICKLGSIKLIDAMSDTYIEEYIYNKYKKIITDEREKEQSEKYTKAVDLLNESSVKSLKKAISLLKELNDYRDSEQLLVECNKKYKEFDKKRGLFTIFKR